MPSPALAHIEHLAKHIGPRGSTTPQEKAGHAYVDQVLTELKCSPRTETFTSGTSAYLPFLLALCLMLLAEALFFGLGRTANSGVGALAALAVGLLVAGSIGLELTLRDNPLRWFVPSAPSQNVIGVTAPSGEIKRRVAVLAHVDSHRTPLFWANPNTYRGYRLLTTMTIISLVALVVMFGIGLVAPSPLLLTLSLLPTVVIGVTLVLVWQAHVSAFTEGANDNASGVGVMLALADTLVRQPLAQTEVWWVATGCEEVGAYGSADFIRRHQAAFKDGGILVIDNVGGKNTHPVYLTQEGLALPMSYPADSLALAAQVAAAHPELNVQPDTEAGAYTDAAYALLAGLPTWAVLGYTDQHWIPDWHNHSDVLDNVDPAAVERTEQFAFALLQAIDQA